MKTAIYIPIVLIVVALLYSGCSSSPKVTGSKLFRKRKLTSGYYYAGMNWRIRQMRFDLHQYSSQDHMRQMPTLQIKKCKTANAGKALMHGRNPHGQPAAQGALQIGHPCPVSEPKPMYVPGDDGKPRVTQPKPLHEYLPEHAAQDSVQPIPDPLGTVSLVSGVSGFFITIFLSVFTGSLLGLTGVVLAYLSIRRISENPEKYRGLDKAKRALATGIIVSVFALTLMILLKSWPLNAFG